MFKEIRFRIALWFVGLSGFVYITLTLVSVLFFNAGLTNALDEELRITASELVHSIDLASGKPHIKDWLREVQTKPKHSLATIELYDKEGILLEHYGPEGIGRLYLDVKELVKGSTRFRTRSSPLMDSGVIVGYLQIGLPTQERDEATRFFALTMAVVAPFVLCGLGVAGHIVSDKATKPIQENMEMLRRFLADAAHEVNTPLSIIQVRAESLERKLARDNAPVEDLDVIRNSATRLEKIANDLMLLAELESPLTGARKIPVQVDQAVANAATEFAPKFVAKNITLEVNNCSPFTVEAYPHSIEQVLTNLLENAWRYTNEGGRVRLSVEQNPLKIAVADTGIGIPQENLPLIFERFYRVDKSRSRGSGGAGLGLSIVKAIAEAHQGNVLAESEPGKGSTFTLTFPD